MVLVFSESDFTLSKSPGRFWAMAMCCFAQLSKSVSCKVMSLTPTSRLLTS
ncbi:hypothetical protein EVA_07825 [gut metagenome]|uniref:Uncharacterized protein n=1 Tax=gut metagenome TaxID=749906 RepID=J9GB65_9ZZZZ